MLDNINPHLTTQQALLKAAPAEPVCIPSICEEGAGVYTADKYPFGEAIDLALRKALEVAGNLGFKTHYGDGIYYGYAEVGKRAEMLGVLGHLDVVPPGKLEYWSRDPFNPVEKDGMLFGRGTQDDKSPMIASLFAVKALMRQAYLKFLK
jgi:acetylornithine deacetylase/succinyl-diaminopimelate desuccinylase-like protein